MYASTSTSECVYPRLGERWRVGRDAVGDSAIIGDDRWAGTLGIRADFVARTHCSIAFVPTADILVCMRALTYVIVRRVHVPPHSTWLISFQPADRILVSFL